MTQVSTGSYLSPKQVEQLLAPINPARVLGLKKGSSTLSYVAQHDVRAHLTRIFGFGRWSSKVVETEFMWETESENHRWVACYRATVRLTICAPDGTEIASYEDSHASGNAPQPDRAEAHALALTTAVSTALKRAATCLGDQFGLSLYNKGQRSAFVLGTLVGADAPEEAPAAEVKALGDESDQDIHAGQEEPPAGVDPETGEMTETAVAEALGGTVDSAASTTDDGQNLAEEWLGRLRGQATNPDSGQRILAVAALKQQAHGTDILDRVTQVEGSDVTYARLADLVAAGHFIKEA